MLFHVSDVLHVYISQLRWKARDMLAGLFTSISVFGTGNVRMLFIGYYVRIVNMTRLILSTLSIV